MSDWPPYAIGHSTGHIYTLHWVFDWPLAAMYHTQHLGYDHYILFCRDNFREEKRKGKLVPAILYPCTQDRTIIPEPKRFEAWPWMKRD